jgi:hypothetical protein
MVRLVMQMPHREKIYFFCPVCAEAMKGWIEGGAPV